MMNAFPGFYPTKRIPFAEQQRTAIRIALRDHAKNDVLPTWVTSIQERLNQLPAIARAAVLSEHELEVLVQGLKNVDLNSGECAPGFNFPFHPRILEKAWEPYFSLASQFYEHLRKDLRCANGYPYFQLKKLFSSHLSTVLPITREEAREHIGGCFSDRYLPSLDISLAWLVLTEQFGGDRGLLMLRRDSARHFGDYFRLDRNRPVYRANGDLVLEGTRSFHAFQDRSYYEVCPLIEDLNIFAAWSGHQPIEPGTPWDKLHKEDGPINAEVAGWGSTRRFSDKIQFRINAQVAPLFVAFISDFAPPEAKA